MAGRRLVRVLARQDHDPAPVREGARLDGGEQRVVQPPPVLRRVDQEIDLEQVGVALLREAYQGRAQHLVRPVRRDGDEVRAPNIGQVAHLDEALVGRISEVVVAPGRLVDDPLEGRQGAERPAVLVVERGGNGDGKDLPGGLHPLRMTRADEPVTRIVRARRLTLAVRA